MRATGQQSGHRSLSGLSRSCTVNSQPYVTQERSRSQAYTAVARRQVVYAGGIPNMQFAMQFSDWPAMEVSVRNTAAQLPAQKAMTKSPVLAVLRRAEFKPSPVVGDQDLTFARKPSRAETTCSSMPLARAKCTAQVQHHEQGNKSVPLGREPLCPMFSWVKSRSHYDILVPDGACGCPAHQPAQARVHRFAVGNS